MVSMLSQALGHEIDLAIPNYGKCIQANRLRQLAFKKLSGHDWYNWFLQKILSSVGQKFLPVYRMADGEFIFCVGRKVIPTPVSGPLHQKFLRLTSSYIATLIHRIGLNEKTCWGETYNGTDSTQLKNHYIDCLKKVAEHGILALHFVRSYSRFSEQYILPMCDWFQKNSVFLNTENYASFYFVYALLSGPDFEKLITGKRLLVVTATDSPKRQRISDSLFLLGAARVEFCQISSQKSLLDRIKVDEFAGKIDVSLVGAGIGSVNILAQLEPLETVCIDAGVCLEMLADPSRRGRIFTVPDSSF